MADSNQNSSRIYVSYFKHFYTIKNALYFPVQAGAATGNYNPTIEGDNSGNNISQLNFIYSELTVLYWVWKNAPKTKYVGFCHYRRFFDFSNVESFPLAYTRYSEKDISLIENLPTVDLDRLLLDCDLVIPVRITMPHSLRRNYEKYHCPEHYQALRQAVQELFPIYSNSFDATLETTNKLPAYNTFFTTWELFNNYCQFIFPLFSKLQTEIKLPTHPTQKRVFGYMAERLLAVYIYHHQLKTKEYPLVLFNQNAKRKSKLVFYIACWIKTLNFKVRYSIWK